MVCIARDCRVEMWHCGSVKPAILNSAFMTCFVPPPPPCFPFMVISHLHSSHFLGLLFMFSLFSLLTPALYPPPERMKVVMFYIS